MADESYFRDLEARYGQGPINRFFGGTVAIGDGWSRVEMDVREDFFHFGGAMHGSAYFKMLDDAAWYAAATKVGDGKIVTASFQLYLLRPVKGGRVVASGRVLSHTRSQIIAESVLEDEKGRAVARGSGTFMASSLPL